MRQNPMKFKRGVNQQKPIIIKNDISPIIKIAAIISGPALLIAGFVGIFLKEFDTSIVPFLIDLFLGEFDTSQVSLDYVLTCAVFSLLFGFPISYHFWKTMGTKIILTGQKIIRKSPSGAEFHLYWRDIKTIYIAQKMHCIQLIFTSKSIALPFDNDNRIICPPGGFLTDLLRKTNLSGEAALFIRNKIHQYRIHIDWGRVYLDEIVRKYVKSLEGLNRPAGPAPLKSGNNQLPSEPSSSETPISI
jgi:hypothetical protein